MSEAHHRPQFRYFAVTVEVVASILLLEWSARMDVPFVVFFLVACAWTTTIALLSHSELLRNGALMCGSVLFSMAVVETCMYYANRSQIIITRTIPIEWRENETDVGSLPGPNTTTAFEEFLGGRRIAHVTYRFDANGLREIPAAVQGRPYKDE